jgi:hypothetical protein
MGRSGWRAGFYQVTKSAVGKEARGGRRIVRRPARLRQPVSGPNRPGGLKVNKIRWMIEQVISHFKNWTIMHTDYRRPLGTFATTISAVIGLHFYRMA